jgi:hypothetical protein
MTTPAKDPRQTMKDAVDQFLEAWKGKHDPIGLDAAVLKMAPAAHDLMDWLDAHPGPDTPERRSYVLATTRFAELADVLLDEDVAVSQEAVNCILADLVSLQQAIGRGFN